LPHNEVRLRGAVRGESVLTTVFDQGTRVDGAPSVHDVRRRACDQIASLPDEFRRLRNPEIYRVMLSERIGMLKEEMLRTPDLA
jgi:nicotinate phosphoribosyltransferase